MIVLHSGGAWVRLTNPWIQPPASVSLIHGFTASSARASAVQATLVSRVVAGLAHEIRLGKSRPSGGPPARPIAMQVNCERQEVPYRQASLRSNRPPNPHVPIETNRMANTAPPESDNIVVASRHGLDVSID